MNVSDAVKQRKSIRSFLPDPIALGDLRDLLTTAQRAPSGCNAQPWRVIAVAGDERKAVTDVAMQALAAGVMGKRPVEPPFMMNFDQFDPKYRERFMGMGKLMTESAGIARDDAEGRQRLTLRNFSFFGASVGLFFVLDKRMHSAQWGHAGMYMQTINLLAVDRGWGTCMQEAWGMLRPELHTHFGLAENELIWCGMALGVPDRSSPSNSYFTERASVDEVVTFRGF